METHKRCIWHQPPLALYACRCSLDISTSRAGLSWQPAAKILLLGLQLSTTDAISTPASIEKELGWVKMKVRECHPSLSTQYLFLRKQEQAAQMLDFLWHFSCQPQKCWFPKRTCRCKQPSGCVCKCSKIYVSWNINIFVLEKELSSLHLEAAFQIITLKAFHSACFQNYSTADSMPDSGVLPETTAPWLRWLILHSSALEVCHEALAASSCSFCSLHRGFRPAYLKQKLYRTQRY